MLGRFLGRMHLRSQAGFGKLNTALRPAQDYCRAAVASARSTVDSAWSRDRDRLVSLMAGFDPACVATTCATVMPDISGNQFLFDDFGIAAVVDIDSHVAGPVELELTVAEWCLVDHAAFADGYQEVRPLPKFSDFRAFHRATMLINKEALGGDLDRLLTENAYFD